MFEDRTIVDQIEIRSDGSVGIRFAVQLLKDGVVIDSKWHRTSIPEDIPVDLQLEEVEKHLKEMGRQEFPREEFSKIRSFHDLNKKIRRGEVDTPKEEVLQ